MNRLLICESGQFNPYINLAYEEYLLNNLEEGTFILYLWRNDNTIVIGLNQNAYRECNVAALRVGGGYLARRKTGGGAVYHDKKNLNFSFIGCDKTYDVSRQLDIILKGVKSLGIDAVKSGRNDLTLSDGRKFSGNAFLNKAGKSLHHGTVLIDTDTEKIIKYLTVIPVKLIAKGVTSVASRVVNLSSVVNDITVDRVKEALITTTKKEFEGFEVEYSKLSDIDTGLFQELIDEYSSESFIYGNKGAFSASYDKRFSWGTVSVEFNLNKGIIESLKVYTDSLDTSIAPKVESALNGQNLDINVTDSYIRDVIELIKYGE